MRHLTLKLDDSVTETHCGSCHLRSGDWHLTTECTEFGDGDYLITDAHGPRRHPSCLANERDTKLTHDAAKVTLLGSGAPASTGKNHP